jgi:ribosome biogenesis GTPase / thiamine phosphate phosphatase
VPTSGIVIEEHKSVYEVDTGSEVIACTPSGTVRNRTGKPVVGDHVQIDVLRRDPAEGLIVLVEKRRNLLGRPVIANVDQALYVLTVKDPAFDAEATDRFLFLAESLDLNVVMVINKTDLLSNDEHVILETLIATYKKAGYATMATSALDPPSLSTIIGLCRDKISCFAGTSGVGKTSIMNALFPEFDRTTQKTSKKLGRGRQTTASTMLLKLQEGGYLADTPGFEIVDLPYCFPEETQLNFPELKKAIGTCKFNNCLHENEPGCAIKEMVDKGYIAESRYRNYLRFLGVMRTHRDKYKDKW